MFDRILDLDIGNSYTKWRIAGIEPSRIKNSDIARLRKIINSRVERIRIACVLDELQLDNVKSVLRAEFGCEPEVARPLLMSSGMCNAYDSFDRLGVDRWLAGLAAFMRSKGEACLVIDIGSALTIDTITDKGVFLGGYIIPGMALMQQSLIKGTGGIRCEPSLGIRNDFWETPSSTEEAVQRGASFALVAIVEKAIEHFLSKWPHGRVHLTGGDGCSVAALLEREGDYRPHLVLDGLDLALP